jgi:hypothetical protein
MVLSDAAFWPGRANQEVDQHVAPGRRQKQADSEEQYPDTDRR